MRQTLGINPMRTLLTLLVALASIATLHAQELEYKMELGVHGGGAFYMGDANVNTPFLNTSYATGILARYNINQRMVVKGDLAVAHLSIDAANSHNHFPDGTALTFDRNAYELSTQFEYNFFAYGTGSGFKDSHRLTPYIQLGLGLTFLPKPIDNVLAFHIPIGAGVKYKIAPRWNVGAEWTFRFTTTDRIDCTDAALLPLADPYGVNSKGIFKNRDSYSLLVGYISYDLFAKLRRCTNL